MIAVTLIVWSGWIAGGVAGSNETFQPVGAVPDSWRFSSGAVPVLWISMSCRMSEPADPRLLRTSFGVDRSNENWPVISTWRSMSADWLPDVAVTWIGYGPAGTFSGGFAVTEIVDVPPASTVALAA